VYRSDDARPAAPPAVASRPGAAPTSQPSSGWVVGAVAMMTLPLVITAVIMIAPLAMMWAARKSTNG